MRLLFTKSTVQVLAVALVLPACAFNFELTSQRTALENQIMGTYKELDDDAVLVAKAKAISGEEAEGAGFSAVAAPGQVASAQQNQEFNKDDIEDLKAAQILGEDNNGRLVILPEGVGLIAQAKPNQLKLATLLVVEENRDREIAWQRQLSEADDPALKDVTEIKDEFSKNVRSTAASGHWIQNKDGMWEQKTAGSNK
jgi:hypothetical protein